MKKVQKIAYNPKKIAATTGADVKDQYLSWLCDKFVESKGVYRVRDIKFQNIKHSEMNKIATEFSTEDKLKQFENKILSSVFSHDSVKNDVLIKIEPEKTDIYEELPEFDDKNLKRMEYNGKDEHVVRQKEFDEFMNGKSNKMSFDFTEHGNLFSDYKFSFNRLRRRVQYYKDCIAAAKQEGFGTFGEDNEMLQNMEDFVRKYEDDLEYMLNSPIKKADFEEKMKQNKEDFHFSVDVTKNDTDAKLSVSIKFNVPKNAEKEYLKLVKYYAKGSDIRFMIAPPNDDLYDLLSKFDKINISKANKKINLFGKIDRTEETEEILKKFINRFTLADIYDVCGHENQIYDVNFYENALKSINNGKAYLFPDEDALNKKYPGFNTIDFDAHITNRSDYSFLDVGDIADRIIEFNKSVTKLWGYVYNKDFGENSKGYQKGVLYEMIYAAKKLREKRHELLPYFKSAKQYSIDIKKRLRAEAKQLAEKLKCSMYDVEIPINKTLTKKQLDKYTLANIVKEFFYRIGDTINNIDEFVRNFKIDETTYFKKKSRVKKYDRYNTQNSVWEYHILDTYDKIFVRKEPEGAKNFYNSTFHTSTTFLPVEYTGADAKSLKLFADQSEKLDSQIFDVNDEIETYKNLKLHYEEKLHQAKLDNEDGVIQQYTNAISAINAHIEELYTKQDQLVNAKNGLVSQMNAIKSKYAPKNSDKYDGPSWDEMTARNKEINAEIDAATGQGQPTDGESLEGTPSDGGSATNGDDITDDEDLS